MVLTSRRGNFVISCFDSNIIVQACKLVQSLNNLLWKRHLVFKAIAKNAFILHILLLLLCNAACCCNNVLIGSKNTVLWSSFINFDPPTNLIGSSLLAVFFLVLVVWSMVFLNESLSSCPSWLPRRAENFCFVCLVSCCLVFVRRFADVTQTFFHLLQ